MQDDVDALKAGVHVVVGPPLRLYELLRRQALQVHSVRMFVLDQADVTLSWEKDLVYDIFELLPPNLQAGLSC